MKKWRWMSLIGCVVGATLPMVACGESGDDSPGTGGGGGDATGGVGGTGGDCFMHTGGAIYLPNCAEWVGDDGDALVCGAEGGAGGNGGGGGSAGVLSALGRVCEAGTVVYDTPQPVLLCLAPIGGVSLAEDPCADDHEARVRTCLLKPLGDFDPYCRDDSVCDAVLEACPTLSRNACRVGFVEQGAERVACFEDERDGETCEDRFLRCAYGF